MLEPDVISSIEIERPLDMPDLIREIIDMLPTKNCEDTFNPLTFSKSGLQEGRYGLLKASKVFKEGIQLPVSAHFLDCLGGVTNIDEDTSFRKGFDDGDHDNLWKPIKNQIHHVPWDPEIIQCMISMEDEQGKPSQVETCNCIIKD